MGRHVTHLMTGTRKQWEKNKEKYGVTHRVLPASVFVNDTGLYLITSEEWADWLLGKTNSLPHTETDRSTNE